MHNNVKQKLLGKTFTYTNIYNKPMNSAALKSHLMSYFSLQGWQIANKTNYNIIPQLEKKIEKYTIQQINIKMLKTYQYLGHVSVIY